AQQVISGASDKITNTIAKLKEAKIKVIPLAVSGAFHSPLVAEANQQFAKALDDYEFQNADCPVIQNVDGQKYTEGSSLKENLAKQMTSSVQWVKTVETALGLGAECFIEVGSGKVLSGLIKKIDRSAKVLQVSDPDSLNQTLEELGCTVAV
ncbi:MAG TPA: ACP S-malonyltransferase, partial [Vampirovibrionales bacterium]